MPNTKKINRLIPQLNRYRHSSEEYKRKYEEANHLYRHFETQFAPGHFYSPYPDLKEIERRKSSIFDRTKVNIPGINIREKEQIKLLSKLGAHYKNIPHTKTFAKKNSSLRYRYGMHAYSYTDATVLFCMVNELRPKRIIEIGSGYSSAMMLDINEEFFNNKIDLTFIEPFPELLVSLTKKGDARNYRLIKKRLFEVSISEFKKLRAGDILFIDSTHVSKAGSDVNQLFFEVLPHLNKGVIIHIHDVFYPFEYPIEWIKETRAWNEDYMLRAFLYNNDQFEIIFFNHFLNLHHNKELEKQMPIVKKNGGGSIWLKKNY